MSGSFYTLGFSMEVWGAFLSMLGQGRSSGFFFPGISSMSQYPRVYLRILPEINSVARTGYPVSI